MTDEGMEDGPGPLIWSDSSTLFDAPKQRRSRETMQKIFASAVRLFGRQGFDATTTDEIAADAGVTKGSIYQRFPDKTALLHTIIEAYHHSRAPYYQRLIDARLATPFGVADVMRLYIRAVLTAYRHDADVIRIIERHALTDPRTAQLIGAMNDWLMGQVVELFVACLGEDARAGVETGVRRAHLVMRATAVHLILAEEAVAPDWRARLESREIEAIFETALHCFVPFGDGPPFGD